MLGVIAAIGFGLIAGSFTTVLIARVPAGEDWVRGSSHCPACDTDIHWYDNVPVLGWLMLRGRCRACGERISWRYPLVELVVAGLFLGAYLLWSISLLALAAAYLAVISTALVFIDVDVRRLPDQLVLPSIPVMSVLLAGDAAVQGEWWPVARAAVGGAVMFGYYGVLRLMYPQGMGYGDVKTAGLLGIMAGYLGWPVLAVAVVLGPLVGGILVLGGVLAGRIRTKTKIPYGPALISGAWIAYFVGDAISDKYLNLFV